MTNSQDQTFWGAFYEKHRPRTAELAQDLARRKITEYQFVELLSKGVGSKMSPSRARSIYRYLKTAGALHYPDHDEGTD